MNDELPVLIIKKKNLVGKAHWSVMVLALALVLFLALRKSAAAARLGDHPDQDNGQQVGLISTSVDCLVVRPGIPDRAMATVRLEWEGQVDEAFLVLSAAGSRGAHSIYVNGHLVGKAPVRPGGQPCQAGSSASTFTWSDVIPIPSEVLTKGENVIALTNDANVTDGWTAANLYLRIHGALSPAPIIRLEDGISPPLLSLGATDVTTGSEVLTSSYDGALHTVWFRVPTYTVGISTPLVVRVHGFGGTGEDMVNSGMAAEASERGWLFVGPDMHGTYYSHGKRALAWPGAQHDILDAIEYMQVNYEVDPARIYIIGGSMGGQTVAVMAAKYPDVFAAAAEWKGVTDLTDWYNNELVENEGVRTEIENETGGLPESVPFEYQRRSAMAMPQNARLVPLKIFHDAGDEFVQVYHSYDLRDAINSLTPSPIVPVELITVTTGLGHGYIPDPGEVFDFVEGFTLSSQPPSYIAIRTDESKPYYWLNLAQTGGDHWTQVEASYGVADTTVAATISDTRPLAVAFNLGTTPVMGRAVEQPGMGLPATTYLVYGGGNYRLENYTSGYLTTTLGTVGQFTLTISAIEGALVANPAMAEHGQAGTSTITAIFQDHLGNPAPDGTIVHFSASEGTFPNASATYTAAIMGGQATVVLTVESAAESVDVIAHVENVTASTSIDVIHPAIDVQVMPSPLSIEHGQAVTYTYQITNTGDVTLTSVALIDDNGTPGDGGDDVSVCANVTLAAEATTSFSRSTTPTQTITNAVVVTGQDPLGYVVTHIDSATVTVGRAKIYLPVITRGTGLHS